MTQKIANCHYLYSSARPETMFSSVRSLICYQTWKRDVLKTSKPTLTEISSSGTRDKSTKWSTFGVRGRLANRTGSSRNWPTMSRVPCEAHFVPENGNVKIDHRAWIYGCSLMNVLYFVLCLSVTHDLTWLESCVCTESLNLFLWKCTQTVAIRAAPFGWYALPQTPLGELTALPRPSSWFSGWGPQGKGRREGRGKRREGRGG